MCWSVRTTRRNDVVLYRGGPGLRTVVKRDMTKVGCRKLCPTLKIYIVAGSHVFGNYGSKLHHRALALLRYLCSAVPHSYYYTALSASAPVRTVFTCGIALQLPDHLCLIAHIELSKSF